ncbi:MAG: helix-turn-helix domain-containing protein [Bacteroidota bacterium]|jgi:Zn-dependent peptidase ImmA (M78 family)|nr:ImmA/IrrE family metallo-endopeptidase [Ignavibacteria bacterium]MCU7499186.1 ImmA/IrrE family metallo-endopeptidase [Ignavibacteria bacterium]MCU7513611.1 ImmA/IrrE family metallo-endopeptidase [Ignavibacteria bacterium]MCU7520137.1 ImmA/IrrE family metallo-endopeptidase [Ignavibacteria bacterium]MCU7525709.1 ImmA/IrrE family metallo-endopeptidase [Ignavibacteria bacterium]
MFEELFGNRLKSARIMAGLSLEDLAASIGRKVTKQALQNYEKGLRKPDSTTLIALSRALNVKTDYFFRRIDAPVNEFEFRKKSKLTVKEEKSIKEIAKDYLERYLELECLLGMDKKFVNPLKDIKIKSLADAEAAAVKLREEWKLGLDSMPNLIETLEDNELKVYEADAPETFDGLAARTEDYSLIVVNKNIQDLTRKRFTAAHELAHILLNIESGDAKEKERLCHSFSGALLLPKEVLFREFGQKRNYFRLDELCAIKEEYGISLQAIIRRAYELEIITASKYKEVCIKFSKHGWTKNEPGKYAGEENPKRFKKLLSRALAEGIITISKAAVLANVGIDKFDLEHNPIL